MEHHKQHAGGEVRAIVAASVPYVKQQKIRARYGMRDNISTRRDRIQPEGTR